MAIQNLLTLTIFAIACNILGACINDHREYAKASLRTQFRDSNSYGFS